MLPPSHTLGKPTQACGSQKRHDYLIVNNFKTRAFFLINSKPEHFCSFKTIFLERKFMKKCWSEIKQQLRLMYFVNSFSKLFAKVNIIGPDDIGKNISKN